MEVNQKPSASNVPTVCEVENIITDLLQHNNNDLLIEDQSSDYNLKTAKLLSLWMCDPQRTPEEIYELFGPKFEKLQVGSDSEKQQLT